MDLKKEWIEGTNSEILSTVNKDNLIAEAIWTNELLPSARRIDLPSKSKNKKEHADALSKLRKLTSECNIEWKIESDMVEEEHIKVKKIL